VAGGGLAGLTAACALANAGYRVTLIEKRPFLGGRSYSYTDQETGTTVDNGQHVFLGCCTEYIGFLKRLGVFHRAYLQKRLRVPVIDRVWGTSILSAAPLPPPLHLMPSLLRLKSISPSEKAGAAWALAHIQSLDRARHPELDGISFANWLREKRQSERAIRSLWNLIILPTLNGDISEVNADLALMVFQEGFLRSRTGANVGWSRVGLTDLVGAAARRYIEDRGGEVRLSEELRTVEMRDGSVSRFVTARGELTADAYIVALDPGTLRAILDGAVQQDPFFGRIQRLESSPIVNLHLWYNTPERPWPHRFAAFLNTPVQWLFNKSRIMSLADSPAYFDISLSGAAEWVDVPNAELVASFTKELWSLVPRLRGAELERAIVVKQRHATFAARPGVAALRPPQRTPIRGLYLAGDYTDTGWPATMESAVRSGLLAAEHIKRDAPLGITGKALSRG
jgi:squalene-associated FAD-dependent desaturase